MSYLALPRIHFGGLFFTNPNTINNFVRSFNPAVPLEKDYVYQQRGEGGPPSGWNAVGVAQWWIEQARVLSAMGRSGPVTADAILTAAVITPSPKTPMKTPDQQGFYDIAKMVDIDPDYQFRSAIYGLRIAVTLPDGSGFSGLVTTPQLSLSFPGPVPRTASVPELQYLNGRITPPEGYEGPVTSWTAVGTWMGQITDVAWNVPAGGSAFLAAFQEACARGVAVKLTADLHQNVSTTRLTPGDMFCYGRVLGTFGPVGEGELAQVVPGRQLAPPPASASPALASATLQSGLSLAAAGAGSGADETINDRSLRMVARRRGARARTLSATALATAGPDPTVFQWNQVPAEASQVDGQTILHADLGGAIQLQVTVPAEEGALMQSDGHFVVDSGILVGVITSGGFQPFEQGSVSFADQYVPLRSMEKNVDLVSSCGVVDVVLSPAEAALAANHPLAIAIATPGGPIVVAQEPADGLFANVSLFAFRLEPGNTDELQLMARAFGRPIAGTLPFTLTVTVIQDPNPTPQPSTDLTATLGPADQNGIATLSVTAHTPQHPLPPLRVPLDSQLYEIAITDAQGNPIGDGSPALNIVLFRPYQAPANPTWQDVAPILQAYARLYPGMRDKLDIGDQATVQGSASAIADRMDPAIFDDPAYMPVTRDLVASKARMIRQWLATQSGGATTA